MFHPQTQNPSLSLQSYRWFGLKILGIQVIKVSFWRTIFIPQLNTLNANFYFAILSIKVPLIGASNIIPAKESTRVRLI